MFLRRLLLFTALLAGLAALLKYAVRWEGLHPLVWLLLGFFTVLAGFTYYFVEGGRQRNPGHFNAYFMGALVMRLFVSIGLFAAYLFLYSGKELSFALHFIVLYFLYMGFEIYHIVRNLRPFSKNP